ncbi:MAG TPA: hypothetical protein VF931_09950 [Steroidobacteraceae bacterium]
MPQAIADLSQSSIEDRQWILAQLRAEERQRLSRWLDAEGAATPSMPKESAAEAGWDAEEQLLQATPRALATALATEPTWLVYSVLAHLDVNRHQQVLTLLPGALRSALLAMSFMPVCVAPALRQAVNEAVVSEMPTMPGESGGHRAPAGRPSRFDQMLDRFRTVKP